MNLRPALLLGLFAVLCAVPLSAEEASAEQLPLGMTFAGEASAEEPARFTITVDEAGVLSVVVRAEEDVSLAVYDSFDQILPEGNLDLDYQGDYGAEQGAFVLGQPGEYTVVVSPLSTDTDFQMGANWLAVEAVETPEDPQGRPSTAAELTLDENLFGVIDESVGDYLDWFKFTAPAAGTLTVGTRTRHGDVVLTCYLDGEYDDPIEYSDQDLQGDGGRERIVIDLSEGEVVYFQVRAYGSSAEYALRGVLETDEPLEDADDGADAVEEVDDGAAVEVEGDDGAAVEVEGDDGAAVEVEGDDGDDVEDAADDGAQAVEDAIEDAAAQAEAAAALQQALEQLQDEDLSPEEYEALIEVLRELQQQAEEAADDE